MEELIVAKENGEEDDEDSEQDWNEGSDFDSEDEIMECAPEEGVLLEDVPWGTQVALGEVLEKDHAFKGVSSKLGIASKEEDIIEMEIKVEVKDIEGFKEKKD